MAEKMHRSTMDQLQKILCLRFETVVLIFGVISSFNPLVLCHDIIILCHCGKYMYFMICVCFTYSLLWDCWLGYRKSWSGTSQGFSFGEPSWTWSNFREI